jgi:hypothetical protein
MRLSDAVRLGPSEFLVDSHETPIRIEDPTPGVATDEGY